MGKFDDKTGRVYGRLTVIERAPNQGRQVMWRCRCECGKEKIIRGDHLKSGAIQSCGCLNYEKIKERSAKRKLNLIGQRFGRLEVIEDAGYSETGHTGLSKCRCDCGNEIIVSNTNLKHGNTQSCGCIGSSRGEVIIKKILEENNISFIQEYRPIDLGFNGRFDFGILDYSKEILYFIEYDGRQHFDSYEKTGMYKSDREKDLAKDEYCYEAGIPLVRIPYIIKPETLKFEDIWFETSNYLMSKKKEDKYYAL